jgi:glutathione S-transferase
MMKIYDRSGFPNPTRIRIVIAEKKLEPQIEFVSVDLIGAEHKSPAFLLKNAAGVLPTLELEDGTLISECTAITEYLDNLDGNPSLTGRTLKQKALILMMQKRADDMLINNVGTYFHYATPGLGSTLLAHKEPQWTQRVDWGRRHGEDYVQGLKYFDQVLKDKPYVAGEAFSVADITVFAALLFAGAAGIQTPDELVSLNAWRTRVSDLPSIKNRTGSEFLPEDLKRLGF